MDRGTEGGGGVAWESRHLRPEIQGFPAGCRKTSLSQNDSKLRCPQGYVFPEPESLPESTREWVRLTTTPRVARSTRRCDPARRSQRQGPGGCLLVGYPATPLASARVAGTIGLLSSEAPDTSH